MEPCALQRLWKCVVDGLRQASYRLLGESVAVDVDMEQPHLDAYVQGFAGDRYRSYSFDGYKSKSHYHYNDWIFGSPSQNPNNEADAEVDHDNHSDVSTDSLSI